MPVPRRALVLMVAATTFTLPAAAAEAHVLGASAAENAIEKAGPAKFRNSTKFEATCKAAPRSTHRHTRAACSLAYTTSGGASCKVGAKAKFRSPRSVRISASFSSRAVCGIPGQSPQSPQTPQTPQSPY